MLWLQELTGNESGWSVWDLRYLGFATWGPTRAVALSRAPERLASHKRWLAAHDLDVRPALASHGRHLAGDEPAAAQPHAPGPTAAESHAVRPTAAEPRIAESIRGNEVLFEHDRRPASRAEIELCATLLACTRADLLDAVTGLPDELLDWDPPYAAYLSWARWRTVREILTHVAQTEVGYYLPAIGYAAPDAETFASLRWLEQLRLGREHTLARLADLAEADDRLRLTEGDEGWSVRKVLRRLVWHELLHLKSIRRIVAAFPGR